MIDKFFQSFMGIEEYWSFENKVTISMILYINKEILILLNSTFVCMTHGHERTCINRIQWYSKIVPNFDLWVSTNFGLYLYFLSLKFDLK